MLILHHYTKLYYLSTGPGPVGNLKVSFNTVELDFNSTTQMYTLDMNITWDKPVNSNGVITLYEVTVYQTDSSNDIVYNGATQTNTSVTPSVMVLPFTNYTVTVVASTSGQGKNSVIVLSPEAGNTNYTLYASFNISFLILY